MNENAVWKKLKETLSKPTYLSGEIQRQADAIEDKTSDNTLNKSIGKLECHFEHKCLIPDALGIAVKATPERIDVTSVVGLDTKSIQLPCDGQNPNHHYTIWNLN